MSEHLSHLMLERVRAGEAAPEHLDGCETCQARLGALTAHESSHRLAPPAAPSKTPSSRPQSPARLNYVAPAFFLAAAAAALFFVMQPGVTPPPAAPPGVLPHPTPGGDGWRIKGGFHLQVFVHDGEGSRRVSHGEEVHPGDRVGFRAEVPQEGHLLIAGIDSKRKPYLCYPQNKAGRAEPVERGLAADDQAVRLDSVLGEEEFVAVLCEKAFDFEQAAAYLREGKALSGRCVTRRLKVQKVQ